MNRYIVDRLSNFRAVSHFLWRIIKTFLLLYLITWGIKSTLISVYRVPSVSMVPTIDPGDYILVIKWPYQFKSPDYLPLTDIPFLEFSEKGPVSIRRESIIVFDDPTYSSKAPSIPRPTLVKRCVGLPGDTVKIFPEKLQVDSQIIDHKKNTIFDMQADSILHNFILPKDNGRGYFVMGDNRVQSFDSRYFGIVSEKDLIGRAVARIWPFPPKWL